MQMKMLPYLDQALVLQELSREKDAQHVYVNGVDARFDKLLDAVNSGAISRYKTEEDILKEFGAPILADTATVDGQMLKKTLYRYAIQAKGPHKVYLYFSSSSSPKYAQLVKWEQPS